MSGKIKTTLLLVVLVKPLVFGVAKDLQAIIVRSQSVETKLYLLSVQNLVRRPNQNQNKMSKEHVPKSNKMTRAFTGYSQNQSKLQKLGSCSNCLFSFHGQMKAALLWS